MKILFVSSDNNPSSGAFLSMVMLNRLLRDNFGVETMIVLPREGDGQKLLEDAHIPFTLIPSRDWVIPIPAKKRLRTILRLYAKRMVSYLQNRQASARIAQLARQGNFDLIHINTTYAYVGALAAQKAHLPLVWHLRELLEEDQNRMIWDREKGYSLIRQSDRIIAISQCVYDKYAALLGPDRMRLVFNGIDTTFFYRPEKRIFERPKITIAYGGGYSVRKGVYELASALELLAESNTVDFELLLIGQTNPKFDRTIAGSKLSSHVRFLGYQKDVAQWYEKADIAITCSAMEAFGRKTVEAMLAGTLVIAANTGGSLDIIQDHCTGLLYDQGDPISLYSTVLWALSHQEKCQEIAAAGRTSAYENFNALRNASNIKQVYDEILNKKD